MPVLKLFSLYNEKEPLPVPKGKNATRKLSAVAIYIHLQRKLANQHGDGSKDLKKNYLPYSLPIALHKQYSYLQNLSHESERELDIAQSLKNDFKMAIVCNTFSTAQDYFHIIIEEFLKVIAGGSK